MKKVFEIAKILSVSSLYPKKKLTCQPKTNRLQKKIFDTRKVFFQKLPDIMKIVFLGPKAKQL